MPTGTFSISDLLAARFQSAAEYGLDTIAAVLQADIDAHNAIVEQMLSEMCEITTDRQRIYGTSSAGSMVETDEFGRAQAQMDRPGATVGFPLKNFQFGVGWTEKWLKTHTPADMAIKTLAAEKAHLKAIQRQIKLALLLSANYTYRDHLIDNVDLSVKRLVNADGASIPDGPNGETYDGSTHTHYNANASLDAASLQATIDDVIEHGHGGMVKLAINRTNEAAVRALTGFTAYIDARIIPATSSSVGRTALDVSRLDNRAIGVFGGAEVWVKPWMIANYAFAWDAGSPNKPLAFRQRTSDALQGLRIASELDAYPLHAQYMEAEFGIGVWTRTNGAVLYFAGASYTDPTI